MQGGVKRGVVLRVVLKCQLFREIESREWVAFKFWLESLRAGTLIQRWDDVLGSLSETRILWQGLWPESQRWLCLLLMFLYLYLCDPLVIGSNKVMLIQGSKQMCCTFPCAGDCYRDRCSTGINSWKKQTEGLPIRVLESSNVLRY